MATRQPFRPSHRNRVLDARPLYTTVVIFTFLALYSVVLARLFPISTSATSPQHGLEQRSLRIPEDEDGDCRLVHSAPDKCAFVRQNCHDDEAGLLEYLTLYYCGLGHVQPLAFVVLVLWLGLLFTTIGIAASDFFSVNLGTISTFLGLSESLAGVTFLALGNGSPDVFSTFAAMGSNSGSMAVGELIGAASFITTVVAGSMALVREFRVARKTFVRDICFFIVAVCFAIGFLLDGHLDLIECCVMISFYLFYVIVVVGWHAYTTRRKARMAKEAVARAHFYRAAGNDGNDELEPYRDDPDDEDRSASMRPTSSPIDIEALERAPLIEVRGPEEGRSDEPDQDQLAAAEVTSSMRVNRPRGRRSTTTLAPIRPSLVGALEFRSVLASLQKEGNVHMRPIHSRTHSTDYPQLAPRLAVQEPASPTPSTSYGIAQGARSRALSSGDLPITINSDIAGQMLVDDGPRSSGLNIIGGRLAPPLFGDAIPDAPTGERDSSSLAPTIQRPSMPNSSASDGSVPQLSLSPFPAFTDSPSVVTAQNTPQASYISHPSPAIDLPSPTSSLTGDVGPKPVKWWPYTVLPPPHVLLSTLFPTLQAWHTKSIWDKFASIISVPTIFLLVITLPVVEYEAAEDDAVDVVVDQSGLSQPGVIPAVAVESSEPTEQETEWERYKRSTRSPASSRSPSPHRRRSPDDPELPRVDSGTSTLSSRHGLEGQPLKPPSDLDHGSTIVDEDRGWNRWLLVLQVFTGPLFCVFVVWANLAEDLQRPVVVLVRAVLASLVFSLVLLAALLATTSPDRKPKYHVAFCFLGFAIAIAWISTVAGEVVGVLKAFGVILDISEAILGLTIFAIGNSVGDLVADVTVARLGYPVMALYVTPPDMRP